MKEKIYFDKNTTNLLKGVAIIMMFIHHFFTFPSWWPSGINYPFLAKISGYVTDPFRLCVQIFAFLTGYFYFFNSKKDYKYSFKKITDILIWYWGFFFLFALIAILCGYEYTFSVFILDFLSLGKTTLLFSWYVHFYCISMLLMPLISKLLSKNIVLDIFISLFLIPFIVRVGIYNTIDNSIVHLLAKNFYPFFPIILIGYICARYGIFQKIDNLLHKFTRSKVTNIIVLILILLFNFSMTYIVSNIYVSTDFLPFINKKIIFELEMKSLYTPLFIYAVVNLFKLISLKNTEKILTNLGKYSLLMWFASCLFFSISSEVFKPILYFPHNPILVLLWGLLLCYLLSFILDKVLKKIIELKNKLLFNEK